MFWKERTLQRFARQLAMLLESGVPLHSAFELILWQQKSGAWRTALSTIVEDLNAGESVSRSLRRQPRLFTEGFVETIAWAEAQGRLVDMIISLRLLGGDYGPAGVALAPNDPEDGTLDTIARAVIGDPSRARRRCGV